LTFGIGVIRGSTTEKEIDMEMQAGRFPNSLMWMASIAIILFCAAGIAAIMGWIPSSMGRPSDSAAITIPEKTQANAAKPAAAKVRPASASQSRTAPAQVVNAAPARVRCAECGVIESTRMVDTKGEGTGVGAVGGAVVGGLIGNQVGGGHGKELATVVGAVGGVMAGNEIEKRVKSSKGYEVTIRLEDGSSRVIHQSNAPAWQTGDRVKVVDGAIRSN
jgi:outer membrane lipoprotein SlyB